MSRYRHLMLLKNRSVSYSPILDTTYHANYLLRKYSSQSLMNKVEEKKNEEIPEFVNTDNTNKTSLTELMTDYNEQYSRLSNANDLILSPAQSIPGYKHCYIVQLRHPISNRKIHFIGIRSQSMSDQNEIANEIKSLVETVKPSEMILQLCQERYEAHLSLSNIFATDENQKSSNILPLAIDSLLSSQHLSNTAQMGLRLINYLTNTDSKMKIRMNPYIFSAIFGNKCAFVKNITLADIPISVHSYHTNESASGNSFKYLLATTYKERKKYGNYPGIWELLFSKNSISGVYQWLINNKHEINARERDIVQFAIDMQQKLKFASHVMESSSKSMAYYAYKQGMIEEQTEDNSDDLIVICNIFTMLSIPIHFGHVTDIEMKHLRQMPEKKKIKLSMIRKWIFNWWNGTCWSVCALNVMFVTGISFSNLDYGLLFQWGILIPICYPLCFSIISLRARYRVRSLHRMIIKKKSDKESFFLNSKINIGEIT